MKRLNKNQKLIILTSIITVIVIIGIVIGANIIKTNITNGEYNSSNSDSNNGITLGGVTGTLEDLDTSDATATPEDIAKGKTAYVKGEKITGIRVDKENLEIGQYVEYTPDTANEYSLEYQYSGWTTNQSISQESFKWRILSVNEDGTIDIISDKPTNKTIYFCGALGYNNIVYFLNDICAKQYSNKKLGLTARSIKLEDIENKFTEAGLTVRNAYAGYGTKYGNTYSPSERYYPKIYAYENGSAVNTTTIKKDGIDGSISYYTEPTTETYSNASSLTGTQTFGEVALNKNYFNNEEFYNLILTSPSYYIATRCINCYSNAHYCLGYKIYLILISNNTGILGGWDLYASYNADGEWRTPLSIRPVVTIDSSVIFVEGDGSLENPYKLHKKSY